ncbi:MAG: LacI family DNA-binding transcriptional regulator [Planctomycetota bacterium]
MATIREIAAAAGVSASTVSRALKNDRSIAMDTRARIAAIAKDAGYVTGRSDGAIGLVYLGTPTLDSMYDSSVVAGIMRGLGERGRDLMIVNLSTEKKVQESVTAFFHRKGLTGALIRFSSLGHDICRQIATEGFPHVVLSERFEDQSIGFMDCDSFEESARAVEYLISLGHKRIAFGMNRVSDGDHLDRYKGYEAALTRNDIAVDPSLVIRQYANYAGGASALKMMMSMPNTPTAAFFADPMLGVGAINMAQQMGIRIPDDLSIIGFDDSQVRFGVHPTMTSVCQDSVELGYLAAQGVCGQIDDPSVSVTQRLLPTVLEINGSTAPPNDVPIRVLTGGTRTSAVTNSFRTA